MVALLLHKRQKILLILKLLLSVAIAAILLPSCSILPEWLGEEEEPPIAGERIALRSSQNVIVADEALADVEILVPMMPTNAAWPQALGNMTAVSGNLALAQNIHIQQSANVGGGNSFTSPLVPPPVIADNMLFAMDGVGIISAHSLDNLRDVIWSTTALAVDGDENRLVGGGVAWSNGVLYAAGSEGKILALNSRDGSLRWEKDILLPLRTAPRIAGKMILLLTADNQLLALNRSNGKLLWSHRGISEIAVPLHSALPAVRDGVVLVSYSSGELVALEQESGTVLWEDVIASGSFSADLRRQSHVSPIMARGLSFGAGPERIVAYETGSGRRIWERKISAKQAPWLAGNTLFVLTTNSKIVAMRGTDGGIHWVHDLPSLEDDEPILWYGPIVAGNQVWVVGNHGKLIALSPQTGQQLQIISVPADIMTTPVIANETMFLLDKEATIYALQ